MGPWARDKFERKMRRHRNSSGFSKLAEHFCFCVARLMVLLKKGVALNTDQHLVGHFSFMLAIF